MKEKEGHCSSCRHYSYTPARGGLGWYNEALADCAMEDEMVKLEDAGTDISEWGGKISCPFWEKITEQEK